MDTDLLLSGGGHIRQDQRVGAHRVAYQLSRQLADVDRAWQDEGEEILGMIRLQGLEDRVVGMQRMIHCCASALACQLILQNDYQATVAPDRFSVSYWTPSSIIMAIFRKILAHLRIQIGAVHRSYANTGAEHNSHVPMCFLWMGIAGSSRPSLPAIPHERWEIELVIDEIDMHQRLVGRPLCSLTPAGVIQEIGRSHEAPT